MIFSETKLKGAYVIDLEKKEDERGFFARTWDKQEFNDHHLNSNLIQCSISHNKIRGTLRGMHYQFAPYEEAKVVTCTKGKIFDVIIDLRKNSDSYKEWIGIELNEKDYKMLYIPEGLAHGFQTLEDDTDVFYQISQVYMPKYSRGICWDDPLFDIKWPLKPTKMSKKDSEYELFRDIE